MSSPPDDDSRPEPPREVARLPFPALRTELAGWLAGLGEPALAAATLRGLVDADRPGEAVRLLVRIAVLLARADDAAGAADALSDAAAIDPKEAIACELLGTISA